MKSWMIALSFTLAASSARADQCAWIDDAAAQKAQAILAKQPMTIEFCEPCGDKAPGVPVKAKSVSIGSPQDGYKEIELNGKAVDLAYTYVKTSATKYPLVFGSRNTPSRSTMARRRASTSGRSASRWRPSSLRSATASTRPEA